MNYDTDQIVHLNLIASFRKRSGLICRLTLSGCRVLRLLYIAYELVSILKNTTLCGLPMKRLWRR